MNVEAAVMNVDWGLATDAYRAYRQSIKENRATKDDKLLARAYHALLRGKKVLDVGTAFQMAGVDAQYMPKLAIARADWSVVFSRRVDGGRFQFSSRSGTWGRRPAGEVTVRLGEDVPMRVPNGIGGWMTAGEGQAQVPTIPPQFRPAGALSEFYILFEAVWKRQPTSDPMLLKRIGEADSPLFVVLAAWDLTPLEQAVLRAKL